MIASSITNIPASVVLFFVMNRSDIRYDSTVLWYAFHTRVSLFMLIKNLTKNTITIAHIRMMIDGLYFGAFGCSAIIAPRATLILTHPKCVSTL